MLRSALIQILPPFKNQVVVVKQRQGANDIINEILIVHNEFAHDYDSIYHVFYTGECYSTCRKIWNFLKYELNYNAESGKRQSVKSPSAILQKNTAVDCKHYSLFAGGVLDAIVRNEGVSWRWFYRFASYTKEPIPGHVFVVVINKSNEIWLDPVLTNFDQHKEPEWEEDFKPMALVKISGVEAGTEIQVSDPATAIYNFNLMVNKNALGIKDLLLNNPDVTNGQFKTWYIANGGTWLTLQGLLNSPTQ